MIRNHETELEKNRKATSVISSLQNMTNRWFFLGMIPCLLLTGSLLAQAGRPQPERPSRQAAENPQDAQDQTTPPGALGGVGRRDIDDRKSLSDSRMFPSPTRSNGSRI